jgi:hypothetical protein
VDNQKLLISQTLQQVSLLQVTTLKILIGVIVTLAGHETTAYHKAIRKEVRENSTLPVSVVAALLSYHIVTHELLRNEQRITLHYFCVINAIMKCLAAHINLIIGKVFMTLGQILDACSLATIINSKGLTPWL